MKKPWDGRQNCDQIYCDAERFSLSPAEGERAGVRGNRRAAVDKIHDRHRLRPTPHPDPLPFRLAAAERFGEAGRREGIDRRNVVYLTPSSVNGVGAD